MLSYKIISCN